MESFNDGFSKPTMLFSFAIFFFLAQFHFSSSFKLRVTPELQYRKFVFSRKKFLPSSVLRIYSFFQDDTPGFPVNFTMTPLEFPKSFTLFS